MLSKCQRQKKTCLKEGGSLTLDTIKSLIDQKDLDTQLEVETRTKDGRKSSDQPTQRRYSTYGKPRHNVCMCQEDEEMSNVYSSD